MSTKHGMTFRFSEEYRRWLEGFARHCRTGIAPTIDIALAKHARDMDYPAPPPRLEAKDKD